MKSFFHTIFFFFKNDAPALTQSNVSFAIGSGSDVAIYGSDMTLIHGDLNKVVHAIQLSKETMSVIKQNLALAFVYNILAIPFAATGFFSPTIVISFFINFFFNLKK